MKLQDESKIPSEPYPELRAVLEAFAQSVAAQLKENLLGLYLVGSLACGDFDLDSDVDFLAVIRAELAEADMGPLQDIQVRIHAMGCYPAQHLEGSYISLGDLNDAGCVGKKALFYFDNGSTAWERSAHDNQWHVRWVLRERGVPLLGPAPQTLLPPIPRDEMSAELRATMLRIVQGFQDEIERPLSFWNSRFGWSFFVLTACRMLHTLHTGTVQSKRAGARWAEQFVEPRWTRLIDAAWQERQGVRFGVKVGQKAEAAVLQETLEFLQYALEKMEWPMLAGSGPRYSRCNP